MPDKSPKAPTKRKLVGHINMQTGAFRPFHGSAEEWMLEALDGVLANYRVLFGTNLPAALQMAMDGIARLAHLPADEAKRFRCTEVYEPLVGWDELINDYGKACATLNADELLPRDRLRSAIRELVHTSQAQSDRERNLRADNALLEASLRQSLVPRRSIPVKELPIRKPRRSRRRGRSA